MKKLILGALLLLSMTSFAQLKVNDLIGYWSSEEESTQLFFWKDVNGKMQVQDISAISGTPLDVLLFRIDKNSVYLKTIFLKNDWITERVFTLIDKKTLECKVTGDAEATIIYKKVK